MELRYLGKQFFGLLAIAAAAIAMSGSALAHHPMGGATPTTFWHGFLSGVGHPIIGLDHFAFVVAVGLASAFLAGRYLLPLFFVAGTVVGCLLVANGVALPAAELVIAASVLVLGAIVMSATALSASVLAILFAAAGLFHGGAYAEAIIGAEQTPLLAYLVAFSLTQYAIAVAVMALARSVWRAGSAAALHPRLAGAVVAGIGATFMIEHIEGLLFKAV